MAFGVSSLTDPIDDLFFEVIKPQRDARSLRHASPPGSAGFIANAVRMGRNIAGIGSIAGGQVIQAEVGLCSILLESVSECAFPACTTFLPLHGMETPPAIVGSRNLMWNRKDSVSISARHKWHTPLNKSRRSDLSQTAGQFPAKRRRGRSQALAPDQNAIGKTTAMNTNAGGPVDFQVAFLDAEGALIQCVLVQAESLIIATSCAGEIAAELDAVNFIITAVHDFSREGSTFPTARVAKLFAPLSGFLARNNHPV
jgi:hypothetical protein